MAKFLRIHTTANGFIVEECDDYPGPVHQAAEEIAADLKCDAADVSILSMQEIKQ